MARLKIYTLGTYRVELDGCEVHGFESDKVRLLLLYLAVEIGHPHRREKLATLFWPERSERDALTNLRRALANLRKTIGDHQAQPPFLAITRQTLQLHPQASVWLDAAQLTAVAHTPEADRQTLETAVALWHGDFVAGLNSRGCLALDEWLLLQREQMARYLVNVLKSLIQFYSQRGQYDLGIPHARQRVELEPWQEQGHRELMRLLAYTGQRSLALTQYQTCHQLLEESLGVEPAKATVTLYEHIRQGGVRQTPESVPHHNLPASLMPLIGREQEMTAVQACLQAPDCRLLTLSGPGGIGKTRLALEAAAAQIGDFADGVFFVPLAALANPADVVTAVAETLSIPPTAGKDPLRPLLDYVQNKHLLLLLDNFEHLLDAADQVAQMLHAAPRLHILVTSRACLNLPGEQIMPLTGLSYPAAGDDSPEQHSAIRLFCRHARQTDDHFAETAENLAVAVQICRHVEGLPLAILLAASWVRVLTPPEIASHLDHSLDLLAVDWHDVPDRHRSIAAVLQHSWQLLTPAERELLSGLSVFRGGFSFDAAVAVAGATLPGLRRLINHSLLNRSATGRYYLHALLHQFAQERLAEDGDLHRQVYAHHCTYFCRKMGDWDRRMKGPEQQAALAQFIGERENVSAAWQWAVGEGKVVELGTAVDGLCRFYEWRVRYRPGLDACRSALAMLQSRPAQDASAHRLMIRLMVWQSVFCWRLGDKVTVQTLLSQCEAIIELLTRAGESAAEEVGRMRYVQGRLVDSGDRYTARTFYRQSLDCFRQTGNGYEMARLQSSLGAVAWNLGDYDRAAAYYTQALERRRSLQDWRGVARTQLSLGITWMHQGRFEEAEALMREGSQLRREMGDRLGIADGLRFWALSQMALGEFAQASDLLLNSVTIYEELGLKYGLEMGMLAAALGHEGRFEEANAWCQRGLAYARETGYPRALGYGLLKKGELALRDGRFPEAESALAESQQIYRSLNQRDELSQVLAACACLALRLDQPEEAGRYIRDAWEIVQECRAFLALLHLLPAMGLLFHSQGRFEEAIRLFSLAARYPLITHSCWFKDVLGEQVSYLQDAHPEPAANDTAAFSPASEVWKSITALALLL
jgi:DNA-binding SARP family transcriptional activator